MTKAKLKIKKGDEVIVLTGKDRGKKGTILQAMPEINRVVVQGVNVATHHVKPGREGGGGIERKEASIHASNVALVDPKGGKATRVGYKIEKDGSKKRVARKSGEVING